MVLLTASLVFNLCLLLAVQILSSEMNWPRWDNLCPCPWGLLNKTNIAYTCRKMKRQQPSEWPSFCEWRGFLPCGSLALLLGWKLNHILCVWWGCHTHSIWAGVSNPARLLRWEEEKYSSVLSCSSQGRPFSASLGTCQYPSSLSSTGSSGNIARFPFFPFKLGWNSHSIKTTILVYSFVGFRRVCVVQPSLSSVPPSPAPGPTVSLSGPVCLTRLGTSYTLDHRVCDWSGFFPLSLLKIHPCGST